MVKCLIALVAFSVFLVGCSGAKGSADADQLARASTRSAIPSFETSVSGIGGLIYFLVSEADQGSTDLNGDLDTADNVVHQLDPETGVIVNLGVSGTSAPSEAGGIVIWAVSEFAENNTDFNNDGDFGDTVVAVFDPMLPVSLTNPDITNIEVFSSSVMSTDGSVVVILTAEVDAGVDLNGDGDTTDLVFRSYDFVTETLTNSGFAADISVQVGVGNGIFAFAVSEADTGAMGTDLNGDTDTDDAVVAYYRFDTATWSLAGAVPSGISTVIIVGGTRAAPYLVYTRPETLSGNLNAIVSDTDMDDDVVAIFNINAAIEVRPLGGIAVDPAQLAADGSKFAFVARELENGPGQDFNSDGDTDDEVVFWGSFAMPSFAQSIGFASPPATSQVQICDDYMVFLISEDDQGTGTNYNSAFGDTDTDDTIGAYLDLGAPGQPVQNTHFAAVSIRCFPGEFAFLIISEESEQGGFDTNEDGDTNDRVPLYYHVDAITRQIRRNIDPIIMDGPIALQFCDTFVRMFGNASESNQSTDFNEDGDMDDYELIVAKFSRVEGRRLSFKAIHTTDTDGEARPMIFGEIVLFPFAELMFGTAGQNDNAQSGDSDVADVTLQYVRAPCP